MSTRELAEKAAAALDARKGSDIVIIDIAEKSSFADYFIIASGGNTRQVGGLADEVDERLAEAGFFAKSIEGKKESGWILMDYGDIIVNVFTAEMRDKYNIEKLWGDCETTYFGDREEN